MTSRLEQARAFLAASMVDEGRELAEDLDGALAAFEQVLADDPNHAEALRERARLLARLGRDSLDAWARAAASAPQDGAVQLGLGVASLGAGHFTDAVAALDRARALGAAGTARWRALVLCELGRFTDALVEFDACTLEGDCELRVWRAHALSSLGRDAQWDAVLSSLVHDVDALVRRFAATHPDCRAALDAR